MADEAQGPAVGAPAPDFNLESSGGGRVRLSDFKDRSSVMLVFYPGDFTPICTRQLCSYSAAYVEFQKKGFEIFGVGSDSPESHRKFTLSKGLPFALLSDPTGETCRAYGVWGPVLKKPKRAIFLIDKQGVVRFRHIEMTRLFYQKADSVLEQIERAMAAQKGA